MFFAALIGWFAPRLTLFLLWLFTTWTDVIAPWWLGVLGFLILPYTTLAYTLIHHYSGSVETVTHLVLLIIAFVLDGGIYAKSRRKKD